MAKLKGPDNPWPLGSLCVNLVNMEVLKLTAPAINAYRVAVDELQGFLPDFLMRPDERRKRPLQSVPMVYVGMNVKWPNDGFNAEELSYTGNVDLTFMTNEGSATWRTGFNHTGQRRLDNAFLFHVRKHFRCLSRSDRSSG